MDGPAPYATVPVDGFPALGNEAFMAWLNAEDR
jgi:hypothetical protein